MRKFTKTHNSLTWLFPIAKTKKEAEKVFDYVEEQAKTLADHAGIKDEDMDLAIDCYMKGYSYCMQLEVHREIEKAVNRIYRNLFNIKPNYDEEKTRRNGPSISDSSSSKTCSATSHGTASRKKQSGSIL